MGLVTIWHWRAAPFPTSSLQEAQSASWVHDSKVSCVKHVDVFGKQNLDPEFPRLVCCWEISDDGSLHSNGTSIGEVTHVSQSSFELHWVSGSMGLGT